MFLTEARISCKRAFARIAKSGVPLFWKHDVTRRIGFVESLCEDERGLRVVAHEHFIHAGAGLSFGYPVIEAEDMPDMVPTASRSRR